MTEQEKVILPVRVLEHARGLPLPRRMTEGAAGMDLHAAVTRPLTIGHGEIKVIPTGLQVAVPEGFELQIRPRSGLAAKHGIGVLNSPGTIDADYRGEIMVIAINLGGKPFTVQRGDRIAQMVLAAVPRVEVLEVEELPATERGANGFGSTGLE